MVNFTLPKRREMIAQLLQVNDHEPFPQLYDLLARQYAGAETSAEGLVTILWGAVLEVNELYPTAISEMSEWDLKVSGVVAGVMLSYIPQFIDALVSDTEARKLAKEDWEQREK